MTIARRPLVAGNWKMNGSKAALEEIRRMGEGVLAKRLWTVTDLAICPPAPFLLLAGAAALGTKIAIGAQDCHPEASGAFTGDVAAEMIAEAGCAYVIVGHSERRSVHGESDALVQAKARAALRAGLTPIICVGETQSERQEGRALSVVQGQIEGSVPADAAGRSIIVAYEPVWAIGTGLTPTPADVAEVHAHIRSVLRHRVGQQADDVRILYGGSVKPANGRELMAVAHVDGALVGGASLKADDFLGIAAAYQASA